MSSGANRATVVVKVGGKEVARQQVRVSDGDTLELEVPVRDVADRVGADVVTAVTSSARAQFRATGVK